MTIRIWGRIYHIGVVRVANAFWLPVLDWESILGSGSITFLGRRLDIHEVECA